MKRIFFIALAAFLFPGCFLVQRLALENCEFRLAGTEIKELALTYLRLGVIIDVTNPNRVEVVLDRMRFDLYVNDQKIANATSNIKKKIASGASAKIEPVVTIDYAQAGAAVISMIKNLSARYKVVGTVYFDTPIGTFDFPVTIVEG